MTAGVNVRDERDEISAASGGGGGEPTDDTFIDDSLLGDSLPERILALQRRLLGSFSHREPLPDERDEAPLAAD